VADHVDAHGELGKDAPRVTPLWSGVASGEMAMSAATLSFGAQALLETENGVLVALSITDPAELFRGLPRPRRYPR
jgi:hypothetical protein